MEGKEEHMLVNMPDGSIQIATKVQAPPKVFNNVKAFKGRLICWNCKTMLEFILGAM
jgi:hypothetical protein